MKKQFWTLSKSNINIEKMCEIEIPIIIGKNLATYKLTLLLEAIMRIWTSGILG